MSREASEAPTGRIVRPRAAAPPADPVAGVPAIPGLMLDVASDLAEWATDWQDLDADVQADIIDSTISATRKGKT